MSSIGAYVVAIGWVVLVVALAVVLGVWTLIPSAVVMIAVGLFVDLDPGKEPARGKRR